MSDRLKRLQEERRNLNEWHQEKKFNSLTDALKFLTKMDKTHYFRELHIVRLDYSTWAVQYTVERRI
jgi:hypothetical protein